MKVYLTVQEVLISALIAYFLKGILAVDNDTKILHSAVGSISKDVSQFLPVLNFTLVSPGSVGVMESTRMKRSTLDDDFYNDIPTIQSTTCQTRTSDLQQLKNVLDETILQMMSPTTTTPAECSSSRKFNSTLQTSDCQLLLTYIRNSARNLTCEYALLKQMNVVSNGQYLAVEAKYENKLMSLNKVIDKLKQSHSQTVAQIHSEYTTKLNILQARIISLLEDIKDLKVKFSDKIIELIIARIKASEFHAAMDEYRSLKMNRDISIPRILKELYISGDTSRMSKIGSFLDNFIYLEEIIVACNFLFDTMKGRNDLSTPNIVILQYPIKRVVDSSNFQNVLPELRALSGRIEANVETSVKSVISTWAINLRNGDYSNILSFGNGMDTQSYFVRQADLLINSTYQGQASLDQILPFIRTLKYPLPTKATLLPLIILMKENGDIYSKKGLELLYTINREKNLVVNGEEIYKSVSDKIPLRLNIFGKKCVFHNLDKGNEFLAATSDIRYSNERRWVVTHPNSWSPGNNAKWTIFSHDFGKTFEIRNVEYGEYLYCAGEGFKYDKDRRSVFTWIGGRRVTQGVWEIEVYGNGDRYKIKNTIFGEKLYAAIDAFKYSSNWRRVFTWGQTSESHYDEFWQLSCN